MSNWIEVVPLEDIPVLGSRVLDIDDTPIALFRSSDDQVFALKDECPHKQGPLSQGIVHGHTVTCPLHNWRIELGTGQVQAPDEGCTNHYPTKLENGIVWIDYA